MQPQIQSERFVTFGIRLHVLSNPKSKMRHSGFEATCSLEPKMKNQGILKPKVTHLSLLLKSKVEVVSVWVVDT